METNGIKYSNDRHVFEDLAKLLSAGQAAGHAPANNVAGLMLPYVFGDEWQRLSNQQKELMIGATAQRLAFAFTTLRTTGEKSEEAARQAIESELTFLTANLRYAR